MGVEETPTLPPTAAAARQQSIEPRRQPPDPPLPHHQQQQQQQGGGLAEVVVISDSEEEEEEEKKPPAAAPAAAAAAATASPWVDPTPPLQFTAPAPEAAAEEEEGLDEGFGNDYSHWTDDMPMEDDWAGAELAEQQTPAAEQAERQQEVPAVAADWGSLHALVSGRVVGRCGPGGATRGADLKRFACCRLAHWARAPALLLHLACLCPCTSFGSCI